MNKYTEFAFRIVLAHNERESALQDISPNSIDHIEFLGEIRQDGAPVRELLPNQSNPALMDLCEVTRYAGKFSLATRFRDQKRVRKSVVWYFVGSDTQRLEIGSHYSD